MRERLTFAEAAERYLHHVEHVRERKRSTVQDYRIMVRRHLAPFLAGRSLDGVEPDLIAAYITAKRREGLAGRTINHHLTLLHGIYAHAVRRGWTRANPVLSVDRPPHRGADPDIRFLQPEELEAVLRAVPDDHLGALERVLYLTAAMTGLRQGELLGLRWRDIDWMAGVVRVRQSYTRGEFSTPKSRRSSRAVPLADRVAAELERHHRRSPFRRRRRPGLRAPAHRAALRPLQAARPLQARHRAGRRSADHLPWPAPHLRHPDGRRRRAAALNPGVDGPPRPHDHPDLRRLRPRPVPGRDLGRARVRRAANSGIGRARPSAAPPARRVALPTQPDATEAGHPRPETRPTIEAAATTPTPRRRTAVPHHRGRPVRLERPADAPDPADLAGVRRWVRSAQRPTAVDLFCGAGGLSLGLRDAGFTVLLGADSDPWSVETHTGNLGGLGYLGDLADPTDLIQHLDAWGIRRVDLVAGGPPCQPFSRAGHSKIRSLIRSGERIGDDPRAQLWRGFMMVVEHLRPRAVLIENVPELPRWDDGAVLTGFYESLRELDYDIDAQVLDAYRHGVPQHRARLVHRRASATARPSAGPSRPPSIPRCGM